DIRSRKINVAVVNTNSPSPFASSLMFNYIGNFIYEGDAPLAERRAQALAMDPAQLKELLGDSELQSLLDPKVMQQVELELQHLDAGYQIRHKDGLHDLLLRIGDLTLEEIKARSSSNTVDLWIQELVEEHSIQEITIAGEQRWIATEDAERFALP